MEISDDFEDFDTPTQDESKSSVIALIQELEFSDEEITRLRKLFDSIPDDGSVLDPTPFEKKVRKKRVSKKK